MLDPERDLFALRCHQCNEVIGVFVRAEYPEAFSRVVTSCAGCLLIEEAEQITREAATA